MKQKNPILNAILYIINNILVKAFQFFLVPVYTAYLTTEQYGVSNLITSFTLIGGVLITLSIGTATSRYYVECKGDKKAEQTLFSSLYLFVTLFGLAAAILLLSFRVQFSNYIFGVQTYVDLYVLAVINLWLSGIAGQYKGILMATQEATIYTVVSITGFVVQLALTIYFVICCNAGVVGILCSMIIANILTILFSIYDLCKRKRLALRIDFGLIVQALKYSLPLIPHSLSSTIAQFLSRIFIGNAHSLSVVGLYGLAGQFGHIIDTIQGSVHSAYIPWFFEQKKRSEIEAAEKIRHTMPIILIGYNILYLGFILFSQELISIIAAREYAEAWKLIPLFALNYAIKTPYYFYVSFLFYDQKRVRYIFMATLTSSVINVVLSAVLVKYWGTYGSVFADIVATIIQVAFVIKLCKGENSQYFRYSQFFKSLLSLTAMSVIGLFPGFLFNINGFTWAYVFYKGVIWMLFCGAAVIKNREQVLNLVFALRKKLSLRSR